MRVLIATTVFPPSIGGVEMVATLLARSLRDIGHEVTVLTNTPAETADDGPVTIVRQPSPVTTLRHYLATNAVILMGLTLQLGWPLLFLRRSAVTSHQGYPPQTPRSRQTNWPRRGLVRRTKHIACSASVADSLGYQCEAVGNPYDDAIFKADPTVTRDRELIFVGRLVPEKGPDVLLNALAIPSRNGVKPRLTIAGDGPLRPGLEAKAADLGLAGQVEFVGPVIGKSLAALLNRHHVLVVPSTWNEPFGIVTLEGIACGCFIVGSSGGGLPEAIGRCGLVFPNGDSFALASVLQRLVTDQANRRRPISDPGEHLRVHWPASVAHRYLQLLGCRDDNDNAPVSRSLK